jgi:hypothetical protein
MLIVGETEPDALPAAPRRAKPKKPPTKKRATAGTSRRAKRTSRA